MRFAVQTRFKETISKEHMLIVVEDHAKERVYFHQTLGHRFTFMMTDQKRKAYALAHEDKPALIILAARLYGQKTLDLCINLKNDGATKAIPVLVLADHDSLASEFFFQDVKGFLRKPFSKKELLEHVCSLTYPSSSRSLMTP